ncbi:MAG: proprotein convertase P-domain-containing protein [Polyangiales bacterium]
MTMHKRFTTLALVAALGGAGCGTEPPAIVDNGIKGIQGDDGKTDRWDRRGDPARFRGQFNYHLEDLPLEGSTEADLWPSTYWPTYADSINHRWHRENGELELSPAEKYDMAFNGWTPPEGFRDLRPFDRESPIPSTDGTDGDWDPEYYENLGPLASLVSGQMGNGADRQAAMRANGEPEPDDDGEIWPVETWFGLCHAWVPAAVLELRPERTVTYNGVDFHVGDIEALLIAAYNRAPADMIGGRCNQMGDGEDFERDEYGRAVDVQCRDTNPGALHVILTNRLGIEGEGFAMDRTWDYQVWNQPISGYEVTKQEEITVERANELLMVDGSDYIFNDDADKLYEVNVAVRWITESHASVTPSSTEQHTRTDYYRYILEVDADGEIIGGEYYGGLNTYPDFLWDPRPLSRSSVRNLDLAEIRMLRDMSREPAMPVSAGAHTATGPSVDVPDNDANGVTSVATISGAQGAITNVNVAIDMTHTYIGDLLITLTKGDVTRTVHNNSGGGDDNINDDFTLTGFDNVDPNGEWVLTVADSAGQDVGTLNGWTLNLVTNEAGEPMDPPTPDAQRFSGNGSIDIPDNNSTGITSSATVSGITSGKVAIEVDITHTWRGDLQVSVAHNGRSWMLHNQEGSSADDLTETYQLDETGDAFEGDPSGEWILTVSDNAGQDLGSLNEFTVLVTR